MKKLHKSILILSLLSISVEARNFKIFVEENGVDTNFPFELTDDFIFELGYYSNRDDTIENFTRTNRKGKKANKVDENNIFASIKYNIIKVVDTNIFVGVEYERFKRDTEEIGYFESKSNQLPFNSSVKLKGNKFNIISEAVYGDDSDVLRGYIRATVTPKTTLDVEQETKIFPNATTGGDYKGDATFDQSYKIEGELKLNAEEYIDIGIGGSYNFIPYEYQYKGLNDSNNAYVEKTQTYDEKTQEYFIKIRLKKIFKEILPTIGYKWLSVNYTNYNDDNNNMKNYHNEIFFVGIETWF